ncbi:MAG: integrase core domain-containing protein [Candidatus Daviesbacteria bacterium]|nr:integrase core domain-containing protein [Candidatus Daviesbacteria bacterium]
MRAYKILPVEMKVKDFNLSKDALKRLYWMDWYFSHGKNAEATCRHFSISKSVFYRWLPRFSKFNLATLEERSKRPIHLRGMTTNPAILKRIYQVRLNDMTSKYKIKEQLKREGINISTKVIQTDNGSEYLLYFHDLTQKLNIPHYFSYPHSPKMNSRVERLIQTIEYEFFHYQDPLPEIDNIQRLCGQFNLKYNQLRFHQAISYKTPQEYVTTLLS